MKKHTGNTMLHPFQSSVLKLTPRVMSLSFSPLIPFILVWRYSICTITVVYCTSSTKTLVKNEKMYRKHDASSVLPARKSAKRGRTLCQNIWDTDPVHRPSTCRFNTHTRFFKKSINGPMCFFSATDYKPGRSLCSSSLHHLPIISSSSHLVVHCSVPVE